MKFRPDSETAVIAAPAPIGSEPAGSGSNAPEAAGPEIGWADRAKLIVASPAFWPGVLIAVVIGMAFSGLLASLDNLYFGKLSLDGYYSHGPLVPIIAGVIVFRNWDRMKDIPVKGSWFILAILLPLLYLARIAQLVEIQLLSSCLFVLTLLLSTWFLAGWRWMMALSPAILYLFFGLPVFTSVVDIYTNPLQSLSTTVAYEMLKVLGFQPIRTDVTTIYLNRFTLSVEVPCSGLKLLIAVTAFTVFFVLIGRLNWLKNLLMIGLIIPLCLFINGLRIAMIGVVGDTWGQDAGHAFHDYSGYIELVLCFFILFKFARLIGWKD